MAIAKIQPAFSLGEVTPELFGRVDLARLGVACSTFRNAFVRYTGGFSSRAGTKFINYSKQTGRAYPPRLVPFQFSINQGLVLEFGHQYMRVIQDGEYISTPEFDIIAITNANPANLTCYYHYLDTVTFDLSSTLTRSYVVGQRLTVVGGSYVTPAILNISNLQLYSTIRSSSGTSGYAPGDQITLAGGTFTTAAILGVATTWVVSGSVVSAGTGGTPGTATITGTTGTGTRCSFDVTIGGGGGITAINFVSDPGDYTVNPTNPSAEPFIGGGLSGAVLDIKMGVHTFSYVNRGIYSLRPTNGQFTQGSTTGSGTGAAFDSAIMAPNSINFPGGTTRGVYSSLPPSPFSTAEAGGAEFTYTSSFLGLINNGDWIMVSDCQGMTQINGGPYIAKNANTVLGTFDIEDVYGNNVDSTAWGSYTGSGKLVRFYTVNSPYNEEDLAYLKWTQSKDVMSICCVNQISGDEYKSYDLTRLDNADWRFVVLDTSPLVDPPTNLTGSASTSGTTYYQYVVTSVNPDDGSESVASNIATISNAVNIAATAGAITLTWDAVEGVRQYNIYKATPQYNSAPPVGAQFGFAGFSFGTQFIDSNITPDFTQSPPMAENPFAFGKIIAATPVSNGSGYSSAVVNVTSLNGTGANIQPIIIGGQIVAYYLIDAGQGYSPDDIAVVSGDGTGATLEITVGPQSGTYPATVAYFQQRRVYGYSLNQPDNYWFSQPGAFTNFDSRIPAIDSDAISGAPWSQQVNGIQWMVPMPGGLVVMTGSSAWQLTGSGGSSLNPQAITPTNQQAQPQAFNGVSQTVPPIRIDNDILYVQAKGSIYRNLSYELLSNIYTGADMTLNSAHLFNGFTMVQHAWCEEPYKVLWTIRNDGTMLSLTFVKSQEVAGWARHDTANGNFVSVCSVIEPPVDALYCATQRFGGPTANGYAPYFIERMDNRIWSNLQDTWCVDCGLELEQPEPAANLTITGALGGSLTSVTNLVGGSGYSPATTATVSDESGNGSGAIATVTVTAGVVTAITFGMGNQGSGYIRPKLTVVDPAGSAGGTGASADPVITQNVALTASANAFSATGDVVRAAGGSCVITTVTDPQNAVAAVIQPFTGRSYTDSGGDIIWLAAEGDWTLTAPVSSVSGLAHLEGMTVTGLADGKVIPPVLMTSTGTLTLPQDSTSVVVGLPITVQGQSVYLNAQENPTVQGQRKKVAGVTARVSASGPFQVGANEVDGSTQSPIEVQTTWSDMKDAEIKSLSPYPYRQGVAAGQAFEQPLYTGDTRIMLPGGYGTKGQVAWQQTEPYPLNILAIIPEFLPGDKTEIQVKDDK